MSNILLVSLYTTRAVINALGVVDFGVYNVVAGFVTMFAFVNTSMTNAIQRFYNITIGENNRDRLVKVFNCSLQIQLLLSVIVLFLLETIGLWYIYNKMVIPTERFTTALWIYQASIISLLLVIIQVPFSAAIVAHERMGFFALVSIIDAVAKLAIAIVLPYINSDRLLIYGLLSLAISIVNTFLYLIYSRLHFSEIELRVGFDKEQFRSMLSFSGWNLIGTFAFMIRAQGITVLLNFFFGAVVNAAQGVAAQVQSAIQGFSGNIVVAFRPQMIQSYAAGEHERVCSLFFSLSKISYLMLFMLSVPVAFEVDYILKLWLGSAVPDNTSIFTILVLANMVLLSLHTPIVTIIHATGKMTKFQIVTGIIVCSILPVSWAFLILGAKPDSVYWISLFVFTINQIASLFILKEVFPYSLKNYFQYVIFPISIISVLVIISEVGIIMVMKDGFLRLVVVCAVSVAVTLSVTYLTLTQSEKLLVWKLLFNRIRKKKSWV